MGQGEISAFLSYYLRNANCKAIVAIDSDSSNRTGQSKLKTFWKEFTILNAVKDIQDSCKEVKILTLRKVWKKLILTLLCDFEGLKTSVGEVTADMVEIARELESEVEPKGVTEWW